ncbi:MAG: hypothetical protein WCP45_05265 [Verrucomicrobiota bacterium]
MAKAKISIKDVPPRERGEESATEKQLDYLRRLTKLNESDLARLGKWQASNLIDIAKMMRDQAGFSRTKITKKTGCLFLIVVAIIMFFAIVAGMKGTKSPPNSDDKPNPKLHDTTNASPGVENKTPPIAKPGNPPGNDLLTPLPTDQTPSKKSEFLTNLEGVSLPLSVISTDEFTLLNEAGKETDIPIGTIIKISERGAKGSLTTEIKGKLFVGNELRLLGKVKPQ